MKKWRQISGVLSIIYAGIVLIQSGAVGMYNGIINNGSTSGSVGFVLMIFMVTAGVVSIMMSEDDGVGCFATFLIFGTAGWYGYNSLDPSFPDLKVWTGWCILCAIVSLVGYIRGALAARRRLKTLQNMDEADSDE